MDFYFNKYPDIRNTWFLEFFLHSNLAYSGIYSYANAKYCSLLHKYYLYILQINSTNTVHAGLNLFAGAKAGNSHCTGNNCFCFPTNFCAIFHYFQNLFKSILSNSNLFFKNQISLFSNTISTFFQILLPFKFSFLYGITLFPNVSIIFPFYKYLSFFPQISHQILNHLSKFYFIIHFLFSFLARMAKWIETLFLTVVTIATVITTFFCLHSPEECGLAMAMLPIIYMLLIIAWFINRHF